MYFVRAPWLVAIGSAAVNLGLSVAGNFFRLSDEGTSDARSLAVHVDAACDGRAVAQLAIKVAATPRAARRRCTSRQYQWEVDSGLSSLRRSRSVAANWASRLSSIGAPAWVR